MTDDFDKRPPDDEPEDDLDWLRDVPDDKSSSPRSGDNLGFTGELSWRQELQDAFDNQLDEANNTDTPDWQRTDDDKPAAGTGKGGSLGFTGELDWLRASGQGQGSDEPPVLDDTPDWMRVDDEQPADESPSFNDAPTWMQANDEPSADEQPVLDDTPDWLNAIAPTPAEPEAVDTGVPDWLAHMDLAQSTPPPDEAAEDDILAGDSMDWLRQDDLGEDEPIPALDDDTPDWMSQLRGAVADDEPLPAEASPAASPPDTGELAWLQEYAAEPTAEQEIIDPAETDQADIPDWLSDMGEPEQVDEAPAPISAAWMDDADSEIVDGPQEELDLPPWLMENAPTDPSDELFGEFDTGMLREAAEADFPAPPLPEPPPGEPVPKGRITDWLERESEAAAARIEQDDFLNTLPEFSTSTGEFPVVPPEEVAAESNWFDENEPEPFDAADGVPAWLSELQSQDELPETDYELPPDEDLFAGLGAVPPVEPAPAQPSASGDFFNTGELRNIDDILSSYKDIETRVSDSTGQLLNQADFDMDSLLSSAELDKINDLRRPDERQAGSDDLALESTDWLADLGVSVGSDDVSAAAIVRKQAQNERDLDELSDPLRALHAAGLDLPNPVSDDAPDNMKALLVGVPEILSPAPMRIGKPGLAEDLVLNAAQREKVNLLQSLVSTGETNQPQLSAIDATLEDAPDLDDLAGASTSKSPAKASRAIRRPRPKIDRLLIAVVLAAAIILPFVVRGLRIGQLPPVSFPAGSPQQVAFDRVAVLQPGDTVLLAAEYGLTDAAELDTTLDTLLRHIFARGARPVIISTNPIGLLHAKNVLERGVVSGLDIKSGGNDSGGNVVVNPGIGLNRFGRVVVPLRDYVIAPFIAGETIGLRNFSQNVAGTLSTDMNGKRTSLQVTSLDDFALIIVIGERSDDIRRWSEQVAPLTTSPMLIAVSSSAAPMAQPYAAASGDGLLVGYKDAYTYRAILEAQAPIAPIPGATDIPTLVPTKPPTATPTPQTPTATLTITPTFTPSLTPTITQTPTITSTPTVTFTPTQTPTITSTPTNIRATDLPPTWTPTTLPGGSSDIGNQGVTIQGVVNVSESVNVRDNPSRSGTPITALEGGSTVQIIGRNEDGTWLKILLPDEREGWVSAQFIRIIEPGTATPVAYHVDPNAVVDLLSDSSYRPVAVRQETTPEATLTLGVPSTLAAPAAAPLPAQGSPVAQTPYRDQRWYAMTLGLLAIIGIITLGAIMNIVRGLLRRGRK